MDRVGNFRLAGDEAIDNPHSNSIQYKRDNLLINRWVRQSEKKRKRYFILDAVTDSRTSINDDRATGHRKSRSSNFWLGWAATADLPHVKHCMMHGRQDELLLWLLSMSS